MAIYRGTGGSAEATNNATVNEVAGYATDAETSATNAASSATSAASSATSASSSATASASSATASESSATASATSASASATSATNASTSASQAASSASAASTSASNALTSETNAAASAAAASTSETNAAASEAAAAASESNASTSETNSAASATNAATSETNAAASETNASNSATASATSATSASNSATSASTSATSAESAWDSFDDRYLGAKASDPTLDNDGDALQSGALYWNTTDSLMKAYDGSVWVYVRNGIRTIEPVTASTATTDLDFSLADNFKLTMSANSTLTFSNIVAGQNGFIYVVEDATGGYSFTLPAIAKTPKNGAAIIQETGADSVSVLSYIALDSSNVLMNYVGDFA